MALQEKHQANKRKLYYASVDLAKALDRVPREGVRWALRKMGVDEWLIRTVMALHTEACPVVNTDAGLSESFDVKVGLNQGSVLSPLLSWMLSPVVCLQSCCMLMTSRAPPLEMKGRVYASCVRSSMTYGSETRPLLADIELKFKRVEMQMIRWMCSVSLKYRRQVKN